jgi:hypothetical protein
MGGCDGGAMGGLYHAYSAKPYRWGLSVYLPFDNPVLCCVSLLFSPGGCVISD